MPLLLNNPSPPLGQPFGLNPDSMQAHGLVGWWPTVGAVSGNLQGYAGARGAMLAIGDPALVGDPVVGKLLSLNGSSQYAFAAAGAIPTFQQTTPFSVSCWFASSDTDAGLIGNSNVGVSPGWWMDLNAGSVRLILANAAGSAGRMARTTSTGLGDGLLHHAAATYDGSSSSAGILISIDGVAMAMTSILNTTPGTLVDNACALGLRPSLLAGSIGDPRVYDRVLSAGQVWQMFAAQTRWELYRRAA